MKSALQVINNTASKKALVKATYRRALRQGMIPEQAKGVTITELKDKISLYWILANLPDAAKRQTKPKKQIQVVDSPKKLFTGKGKRARTYVALGAVGGQIGFKTGDYAKFLLLNGGSHVVLLPTSGDDQEGKRIIRIRRAGLCIEIPKAVLQGYRGGLLSGADKLTFTPALLAQSVPRSMSLKESESN